MRAKDLIKQIKKAIEEYGNLEIDISNYGSAKYNKTLFCTPVDNIGIAISDKKDKIVIIKI